jgi:hypothetical protein
MGNEKSMESGKYTLSQEVKIRIFVTMRVFCIRGNAIALPIVKAMQLQCFIIYSLKKNFPKNRFSKEK